MFRPMRRSRQELTRQETDGILYSGSSGVLALSGDGGWPYAVPLSYVYDGEKIYFHCAASGHKLDAIKNEPRASFCVIGRDEVVPEQYTSFFKSAIVFGRVRVLKEDAEKRAAIEKLARKYSPGESEESMNAEIERFWPVLRMLELSPEHVSGKQCIELVPKAEKKRMELPERVAHFEKALNELTAAEREMDSALVRWDAAQELNPRLGLANAAERFAAEQEADRAWQGLRAVQTAAEELREYYSGGQWLADFEADGRGELPPELPRGVLSEDAVHNALEENEALTRRVAERFMQE